MAHHYVYGSGMSGCLYDNGPHTSNDIDHAIQALEETFAVADLSEEETLVMRNSLREQGIYYFTDPASAGAQYCEVKQEESDPKIAALAEHLDVSYGSISLVSHHDDMYESDDAPGEYLVLTDEEADEQAKASARSYAEECVLSEIPERYRDYFDLARWVDDAIEADGRGHTIGGYDGEEHEETIDGVYYYIYRSN